MIVCKKKKKKKKKKHFIENINNEYPMDIGIISTMLKSSLTRIIFR